MTITTLSSREFNQDAGRAKKAARSGPVFITDRGRPAHVLNSRLERVELLAMPVDGDIDFEPTRLSGPLYQPADLS